MASSTKIITKSQSRSAAFTPVLHVHVMVKTEHGATKIFAAYSTGFKKIEKIIATAPNGLNYFAIFKNVAHI